MAIIKFLALQQKGGRGSTVCYHRQKQQRRELFPELLTLDKIPEYHLVQWTLALWWRQVMMEGPLGTPDKWIQHQGLPHCCPSLRRLGLRDRVVQTPNTRLWMSPLEWEEWAAAALLIARRYCSCVGKLYLPQCHPRFNPCWLVCEGCPSLFSQTLQLYGGGKHLICKGLF